MVYVQFRGVVWFRKTILPEMAISKCLSIQLHHCYFGHS